MSLSTISIRKLGAVMSNLVCGFAAMRLSFPPLGLQFLICRWGNWMQQPRSFLLALTLYDYLSFRCFPMTTETNKCVYQDTFCQ